VQAFLYLKCPECVFKSPLKEQGNFQDHAIENHPLSLQGVYGKLSVKKELNSAFKPHQNRIGFKIGF
jgi:hypothetical protein